MGPQKERLLRLIDLLAPDAEARARYMDGLSELTEEEAGRTAQEIEDILNATPAGQEAIRRFVAKQAARPAKRPPS